MIICAAIKDTRTDVVFGGIRHGSIYCAMRYAGITTPHEFAIEGFLDSNGEFHDRNEAFNIAMNNGQLSASTRQLKRERHETELYSEDLY